MNAEKGITQAHIKHMPQSLALVFFNMAWGDIYSLAINIPPHHKPSKLEIERFKNNKSIIDQQQCNKKQNLVLHTKFICHFLSLLNRIIIPYCLLLFNQLFL